MAVTPARYDRVADDYEAMFGDSVDDPATSALLELLGDVSGMRLLDVPCGQGRVARELTRRGGEGVGPDLSSALLEKARAFEAAELLGTQFLQIDAAAPDALAGEMFDGVVCNYGLSDIDDVRASSKYLSGLPDGAARDDGGPSRLCDPKVGTPPPHREAFSAS